ncbi:hypothetical protein RM530_05920 [Algiphilus sp. W345]|uniref:Uncharacterized protein n=1 Tax=Banduia mediterranea TaxID=3075609 RepID=A0ABU2WGB0_9GAMM|nr:hypothetical protein [Algiphilus sp. W345]MDT0496901.1 hypothetical protein [Algiphilus sp. W345]
MQYADAFLREIESFLGWKLDAGRQDQAMRWRGQGQSAEAIAQRFEKLRVAGDTLNDPSIPVRDDPPTRPQDDDPAEF